MQFMSYLRFSMRSLLVVVAIVVASLFSVALPARSQIAPISIQYDYIQDVIASSPIQLRFPSVIFPRIQQDYYATGSLTTSVAGKLEGYHLYIQHNPDTCLQALSCSEAYVTGQLIDAYSPTIQDQFRLFYTPGAFAGYRVADHEVYDTIIGGQKVTILPWTHGGASAGYEKAVWDETEPTTGEGIRYIIALKMGDDESLKAMVESAFAQRRGRARNESLDWDGLIEPVDTQI
jgi:hypothetical protein